MYDIAIIGAGIIGGAIARELSKYDLSVVVIEKESDVATGTTKANSAIIHAGYDAKEGTLMAKYNALGNPMFDKLCRELSVPFNRCGSMVLAFSQKEREHLQLLYKRGLKNRIPGMKLIDRNEIKNMEPNVSDGAVAALYAETSGIVGPWELAIALLENAAENGVSIELNNEVMSIGKLEQGYKILTEKRKFKARLVINAAGVYADRIHNMVAAESYRINPRKGQYFVMDKILEGMIKRVMFQCPTEMGKGVLVTPTVHGNILLGPNAEDVENRDDLSTTVEGLEFIKNKAAKLIKNLPCEKVITSYAGLRAECDRGDFIIEEAEGAPLFFDVAGIKSPGLSAAPAIATEVVNMVRESLGGLTLREDFMPEREQTVFMDLSLEDRKKLIKNKPEYGRIICRCESITEGEIVDAIHRKVGAMTIDGVKRRCRPRSGRCQGGFCGHRVHEILARELGEDPEDVVLDKKNSYIVTGKTK